MQLPPASIALRAATREDAAFMQEVYSSTRTEEMQLVDWTPEQKQAFLQMQFHAQKTSYLNEFPSAEYSVILNDNVPAGRLIVDRSGDVLRLIDIALLPAHRSFGIGTKLIENLKNEAIETGKCLRLHVENFNPAHRLYERLGFNKVDEFSFYWRMEWNSPSRLESHVA